MSLTRMFTTAGVPAVSRLERWGEFVASAFGSKSPVVAGAEDFHGELSFGDLAGIRVCWITGDRHRVELGARPGEKQTGNYVVVMLQVSGHSIAYLPGGLIELHAGDWSLVPHGGYCVTNPTPVEQFILRIPLDKLAGGANRYREMLRRPMGRTPGTNRLVVPFVRSVFEQMKSKQLDDSVAAMIGHLIDMSIAEQRTPVSYSLADTFRGRIKYYIERRLSDPELKIETIAAGLNCTKRYLHKAFSTESDTISEYIRCRRLDCARADLDNPVFEQRPVMDIAFSWGFNNAAHFTRVFKDRFGVSPSIYRRRRRPHAASDPDCKHGFSAGQVDDRRSC